MSSDQKRTTRPAFSAPLYAAIRQGGKELGQVLPAFPDSVRPVEEPGTLGNPTPAEVTEQRGTMSGYDRALDLYGHREPQRQEPEREIER